MKKLAIALVLLIMIPGMILNTSFAVPAIPNQQLSLRTGPNTRYAELFTLPSSTQIDALAYEEGNGVTWVFVEFYYNGHVQRGYTGLKRMDVQGNIDYPSFSYVSCYLSRDAVVYAAPYTNAAVRGKVMRNEMVTYLQSDSKSDFIYIEFYDNSKKAPSRGYVNINELYLAGGAGAYMLDSSSVYASPSTASNQIGKVGKYEMVGCISVEEGYANIMFYSAAAKDILVGYIPADKLSLSWE